MLHSITDIASEFSITPKTAHRILRKGGKCSLMFDEGYRAIYDFIVSTDPMVCTRILIFLVAGKIGTINDWDNSGEHTGKPLLSWEQIIELKTLGVGFGSHSLTHADLTKLSGTELEREVSESRRILADMIGYQIEGFAYPFGYFNERVIGAVREAGYKWAVTTSDSLWEGWGNPYRLRRINISGLDPDWFLWAKLTGVYDIKAVWELPKLLWEKTGLLLDRTRQSRSIQ